MRSTVRIWNWLSTFLVDVGRTLRDHRDPDASDAALLDEAAGRSEAELFLTVFDHLRGNVSASSI